MITQDRLREVVIYDPHTGVFTWKIDISRKCKTGTKAGSKNPLGYIVVHIDGRNYLSHRLAWFYQTGSWPIDQIDHINGVRDDNRFCNLREADDQKNRYNSKIKKTSISGFKGVSPHLCTGRWMARIRIQGKRKYLGVFDTPEEAHRAYAAAAKKYHGAFARWESGEITPR